MKTQAALFIVLLALAGCGGTASAPPPAASAPPSGSTPTPPPPSGGSTSPAAPGVVTVAAGQSVTGVNIAVVPAQSSPAPNAQNLGVAAASGNASAYNTGDAIHQGETARVLLFGPGLSGSMQVTIQGPPGITVSNPISITAIDKTPGIAFSASVASDAALGARTVVLKHSSGDITTFTGGLEVVP